jgi:hypothetical protein
MKTSEAKANSWHCPICKDETTQDPSGKGYVRHKSNPACEHGHGQRDE